MSFCLIFQEDLDKLVIPVDQCQAGTKVELRGPHVIISRIALATLNFLVPILNEAACCLVVLPVFDVWHEIFAVLLYVIGSTGVKSTTHNSTFF